MPSVQSLTMTYDALNEHGTFSEGDTVTGKVTLVLLKETSVQSLFVKVKGDADVHWTKKHGEHTYSYSARRRYFKLKQFLISEGSKDSVVPQGTHVYTFRFNIPPGSMPSSFRGSHGKIVYKMEAVLSRSWKMNRTVEKEIHFVSKAVPNLHSLMSQQVGSKDKEMGFFSKGHAHMDVIVDRKAYAPGETVAIVAKINNSSSSEMTPKFSLIQDVVYRANGNTKHESNVIHKMVDSCIKPQTQRDVRCAMKIPLNQCQTIQNCEIISLDYYLKVYLDISFAFDPEVMFPLVIIPPDLAPGAQPGVAVGPCPAMATGGPSNSDFPPPVVSMGPYPASPLSGSYEYPGAQSYSTPNPAYPANPAMYAGPPGVYPAQPGHLSGGYNNPMPHMASPYQSPFSSSSSTSVVHPPPTAPRFNPPSEILPPPSAPEILPPPSAPGILPPPSAPGILPPPSAPGIQPPPSALQIDPFPSSTFNISPTAPPYNWLPSAPMMNTNFLSQSDEPPPAYSLLFPSSASQTSDAK